MQDLVLTAIAYTISLATLNTGARYYAMMLIPATVAGPQILVYKALNLHIARPYPKCAAGVAMIYSIGGISNIWASYMYVDAPHYYVAFGTCFGRAALLLTTITVCRWRVRHLNRLLDGTPEEVTEAMKSGVTQTQVDLGLVVRWLLNHAGGQAGQTTGCSPSCGPRSYGCSTRHRGLWKKGLRPVIFSLASVAFGCMLCQLKIMCLCT
jgi:hypothetical protein